MTGELRVVRKLSALKLYKDMASDSVATRLRLPIPSCKVTACHVLLFHVNATYVVGVVELRS